MSKYHSTVIFPQKSPCRIKEEPGSEVQIDYAKMGLLYDPLNRKQETVFALTQIRDYFVMMFYIFGIVKMEYTGEGFEYSSIYYYHPIASIIYLIVIAGIILIAGIIILNKRDISG